jgi:hypothetical protein
MSTRLTAPILAMTLVALGCEAPVKPMVQSSGPYGPYAPRQVPTLWLTYPTEGDANVCLTADALAEFPVHFTMYNSPTGAGVKLVLDPHDPGTDGNLTICGCGTGRRGPCVQGVEPATCVWPSSPVVVSMTGLAVGMHRTAAEIVQADGSSLALPSDPGVQCIDPATCDPEVSYHRQYVNFGTRERGTSEACPLPPQTDEASSP